MRSAALFGSQARGDAGPANDVDLVMVVADPGADDYALLSDALSRPGLDGAPFVSVVLWSPALLARHPWLLIDVSVDGIILLDDGTLAREMEDVRLRLRALGSHRVRLPGGSWYWDLKPAGRPGDVIEI